MADDYDHYDPEQYQTRDPLGEAPRVSEDAPVRDARGRGGRPKGERHIGCPLEWFDKASSAIGPSAMDVAMLLYRQRVLEGSKTIRFSNHELTPRGIDGRLKKRVLRKLEEAGLIRVEQSGKKAPIVTFLDDKPLKPKP